MQISDELREIIARNRAEARRRREQRQQPCRDLEAPSSTTLQAAMVESLPEDRPSSPMEGISGGTASLPETQLSDEMRESIANRREAAEQRRFDRMTRVGEDGQEDEEERKAAISAADAPPSVSRFPFGNTEIDGSHALWHHRGIFWCWRCGGFSCGGRSELLAAKCRRGASESGERVLARIRKGKTPTAKFQWPLPEDAPRPYFPVALRKDHMVGVQTRKKRRTRAQR